MIAELTADIVQKCTTPDMLREHVGQFVHALRILRTRQGAQVVVDELLETFDDTPDRRNLILFDQIMRRLSDG